MSVCVEEQSPLILDRLILVQEDHGRAWVRGPGWVGKVVLTGGCSVWRLYAVPSGGGGADEDCRAPRGAVPPLCRCRVYFGGKKVKVLVTQLCPTLCDPMDCSSPGSSVHGILQGRVLEWVAISFSRDLPDPRIEPWSPALQADSLLPEPPRQSLLGPPDVFLPWEVL